MLLRHGIRSVGVLESWEEGEEEGGGYEFVDSVDEADCFLRGVLVELECGRGRGSAHDCFCVVCGGSVRDERARETAGGGGQSRAEKRGEEAYRSIKALVNGRFSSLYRKSQPALSRTSRAPNSRCLLHFLGLLPAAPAGSSVSRLVSIAAPGQSDTTHIADTSAPSPPPSLCTSPRSPFNRSIRFRLLPWPCRKTLVS